MIKIISNVIILYTKNWKKTIKKAKNRITFHRKIRQKIHIEKLIGKN